MRILIVSDIYYPYIMGRYELGCKDVAEKLSSEGHEVRILTYHLHEDDTYNPPNNLTISRKLQFTAFQPGQMTKGKVFSRI